MIQKKLLNSKELSKFQAWANTHEGGYETYLQLKNKQSLTSYVPKPQSGITEGGHKMVKINLTGEGQAEIKRYLVDEDTYEATVVEISDIYQTTGYEGKEVEKLVVTFDLDGRNIKLPMYMSAIVTKGSGAYSNSKLFDFIDKSGKLEEFSKMHQAMMTGENEVRANEILVEWLRAKYLNVTVKILTKTVNPENGEKYSVVKNIVRFI